MKLFTKKLYDVTNSEGHTETHFAEYHLTVGRKNQIYLISLTKEYYHKICGYAEIIFKI